MTASALFLLGCGGGSSTDVLAPVTVDVTLVPVGAPSPASVGLELASAGGGDLRLDVVARDLGERGAVAFELAFDPAFIEFTGTGVGSFFGSDAVTGAAEVEGRPGRLVGVAAAADPAEGRSGSGTVLSLQFHLLQMRDGETPLTFIAGESRVYDDAGEMGQEPFAGARLVTRIRSAP